MRTVGKGSWLFIDLCEPWGGSFQPLGLEMSSKIQDGGQIRSKLKPCPILTKIGMYTILSAASSKNMVSRSKNDGKGLEPRPLDPKPTKLKPLED